MCLQEFDKQAAKTVQNLFDEIDSVLFEQSGGAPPYIHKECQEWGAQFPHLRCVSPRLSCSHQYLRRRYKGSYISLSLFFCEIWWLIEIRSNSQGHAFSSEIQFLIIWYWKNTWEIYCEFHCLSYTTCWELGPVESRQIWLDHYDPFNLHSFSFFNSQVTIFSKSMIHQSRSLYITLHYVILVLHINNLPNNLFVSYLCKIWIFFP